MLNRGTLLLLLIAIALGGGVLLFENRDGTDRVENANETTGEAQGKPLLPFEESAITQFSLSRPNANDLTFFKDESDVWRMSAPEENIAEGGAIAFLLDQIARPSNRVINTDSRSLVDFGLDDPEATITLEASSDAKAPESKNSTYQLLVGDADFGGDQRYIQVINLADEPANTLSSDEETETDQSPDAEESSETEVHLVSGGIINAIERPEPDWISTEEGDATDSTTSIEN